MTDKFNVTFNWQAALPNSGIPYYVLRWKENVKGMLRGVGSKASFP